MHNSPHNRVAKCHEYDKYIRVKLFAGWGKKSGRRCNLVKFSLFWKDLHNYARFLCRNQPNLIELLIFVQQNYHVCTFHLTQVPKLSLFTRFSWGKIQIRDFAPCKRFDISQLCVLVCYKYGFDESARNSHQWDVFLCCEDNVATYARNSYQYVSPHSLRICGISW